MEICNIDFRRACERGPAYSLDRTYPELKRIAFSFTNDDMILEENMITITTEPMGGTLDKLPSVVIEIASGTQWEGVWDRLVRQQHYLGYQKLLGHRLKYLAFMEERPVGALSFSAPALKLRVRDQYIGWSSEQRRSHLGGIVNNSRFLIGSGVCIPNLASHMLALILGRLARDWEERFGIRPWLVETFVDPSRFKGTSYRAANWEFIGHTSGSGKQGKGYVYHGCIKEVYIYVLDRRFREKIGCERKAYPLFHRPSLSTKKVEALHMILRHAGWNPHIMPKMELTKSDVELTADELVRFHEHFHGCFNRKEQQRHGLAYISGLLSKNEAKSVEPIALEFLDEKSVRSLQQFMKTQRWKYEVMQKTHQVMLAEVLSSPEGMITVDSSEFAKKGKESVGVARQYCGALGKVDNCQSGVFIGYSSEQGYGLLTCRLYMPESWFTQEQEERRKFNLVPEEIVFQTKPEIATDLINTIEKTNLFSAKWIGCDATFGSHWEFLDALPKDKYYFASIHSNTQVFLRKPTVSVPPYQGHGRPPRKARIERAKVYTVKDIAKSKRCSWSKVMLIEGAKGPIMADVACMRVYPSHKRMPRESAVWLFLRRMADGEIKYAFSNAPKDTPLSEFCKAATMRWPIEQCFQDGKSQVGMDQYEHRSWPAWHRHMTYVFLALHFLLRLRIRFKKNSSTDIAASSDTDSGNTADEVIALDCPCNRNHRIL